MIEIGMCVGSRTILAVFRRGRLGGRKLLVGRAPDEGRPRVLFPRQVKGSTTFSGEDIGSISE